jgi:malate dehydrogenase
MSFIAIIGSGAIGGSLAHKLAGRDRIRHVRLIDSEVRIAQGKALDILQAGPVENVTTRVTASEDISAATGADVIVLADPASGGGEHSGEAGLALLRRVVSLGATPPIVLAGAEQRQLIARAVTELRVPASRLAGSAPVALESALRALAALALDGSGVEVSLRVLGVPPKRAVVAWEEAAVFGQPLTAVLPPHEIAALSARIPTLWPPGPYALASAAARVAEGIALGTRRRYSCFVSLGRDRVAAMPVELDAGGVRRILPLSLTGQERTALETAIEQAV